MILQKNNYAFIDSQNLNLSILRQGWKLDFSRFRQYLKDKYNVKEAYIFIGYFLGNEKLKVAPNKIDFMNNLRKKLEFKNFHFQEV